MADVEIAPMDHIVIGEMGEYEFTSEQRERYRDQILAVAKCMQEAPEELLFPNGTDLIDHRPTSRRVLPVFAAGESVQEVAQKMASAQFPSQWDFYSASSPVESEEA